jgi:hypothetical protein
MGLAKEWYCFVIMAQDDRIQKDIGEIKKEKEKEKECRYGHLTRMNLITKNHS